MSLRAATLSNAKLAEIGARRSAIVAEQRQLAEKYSERYSRGTARRDDDRRRRRSSGYQGGRIDGGRYVDDLKEEAGFGLRHAEAARTPSGARSTRERRRRFDSDDEEEQDGEESMILSNGSVWPSPPPSDDEDEEDVRP